MKIMDIASKILMLLPVYHVDKKTFLLTAFKNYCFNEPCDYPIALAEEEKAALISCMKESKTYLEFGSGGSTFLALQCDNIDSVISVESDFKWIKYLRKWKYIRNAEKRKTLSFEYIDIGKVGAWGVPVDDSKSGNYPEYSQKIYSKIKQSPNMVFVDGRFRVACAAMTAMKVNEGTRIFVHDFISEEVYSVIDTFLDRVSLHGTLAEFRKKESVSEEFLHEIYEKYCSVPLA